jgi:hypothetical protein
MPTFAPGELRWATAWTLAATGLATLPYLAAWLLTPPGYQYTWVLSSPGDLFSYFAKIQQSASGAWLLGLSYTSEPHAPALLFPQYVLLGKLAALTGLPGPLLYHLLRIVAGIVLLLVAYRFIAAVCASVSVRRTAFLFTALGGGLSWITSSFGAVGVEVTIPESNTFHTLLANPHFALSTAALLAIAMLLLTAAPRFPWRAMVQASGLAAAAVVMQPFFVMLMFCVGGLWAALVVWRLGLRSVTLSPSLALPALATVAAGGFMWLQVQGSPVMAGWTTQNLTISPPPLHLAIGYGLLLPFALLGLVVAWRTPEAAGLTRSGALLLIAWTIAVPLMFYAPVAWQRRLTEGAHVPLSVLAAAGLWWCGQRMPQPAWRWLRAGVMATLAAGTLWMVIFMLVGAQHLRIPFYLPQDDAAALDWLHGHAASGEVVLASPLMGNAIPGWAPVRAYWGHPFETVDSNTKLARVTQFFSPGATANERCRLMADAGAGYVYEGAVERRDLGGTLAGQPGLTPVFQAQGAAIYRVAACPGGV